LYKQLLITYMCVHTHVRARTHRERGGQEGGAFCI